MWTNFITFVYLTTSIYGEIHHPQVYEDEVEHIHSGNGNIRTARNPETTYRTIYHPPIFSYDPSMQRDYLKHRYALQQKSDMLRMSNRYPKALEYSKQPVDLATNANHIYHRVQISKKGEKEWQPFSLLTKERLGQLQDLFGLRRTEDIYSLERNNILRVDRDKEIANSNINSRRFPIAKNDLDAEASEIVEDKVKIDKRDLSNSREQIIYMNPNLLRQSFDQNPQQEVIRNYDSNVKKPDTQLGVLNELIGKNPNVQLEGLKRLLQATPTQNFIAPVMRGPQPFQVKDHTPITEKIVDVPNLQTRPNIQVNHAGNQITAPQIAQIPRIINKESLADLQKQLDEQSRIQTEQVLARAQKEAQAHVEAQHKAIALAQSQAQKTALEHIQNSLYANAPPVPEVLQNIQAQALVREQPKPSDILPAPASTNRNAPYPSHSQNQPEAEKQPINIHRDPINDHPPQASMYTHVINLPPANILAGTHKNVPLHNYGTKNLLHYAPNHQHQPDVSQAQVHNQNSDIQQALSQPLADLHAFDSTGHSNIEDNGISSINSLAHPEPTVSTYQQLASETNQSESEDNDDIDELQYAAKYAFGYRIKDVKEGNDFGHEERRNGKSAEGSYHVLLPDGRLQKVEYYADNSGYHAKVTYENVAHH